MTDEHDDLKKARFYLQEAHIFFDTTLDARRKLDGKIYNMIVFSGVLVNLLFGLTYFLIGQKITLTQNTEVALIGSVCSYLIALAFGLFAYRPTTIFARDIKGLIENYEKSETDSELISPIQNLAWNLSRDAQKNLEKISRKGFWFQIMLVSFGIGLAFLTLALISVFF